MAVAAGGGLGAGAAPLGLGQGVDGHTTLHTGPISASNPHHPTLTYPISTIPTIPTLKTTQTAVQSQSPDRQYMHRQAVACVRVGACGFVWLLNSSARVNDLGGMGKDDLRKIAVDGLRGLEGVCEGVGVVSGVVVDVVEWAMRAAEERAGERERERED